MKTPMMTTMVYDEDDGCVTADFELSADVDGDGCDDADEDDDSDDPCSPSYEAGTCDCEPDTDGDGVIDSEDDDPNDPTVCSDTDTDGCDDCLTGTYDPANDDTDGDGQCNDVDDDDDGNGVSDADEGCLTDNLLTNGSFETNAGVNGGQLSGYPSETNVTGWSSVDADGDYWETNGDFAAFEGNYYVEYSSRAAPTPIHCGAKVALMAGHTIVWSP